MRNYNWPTEAYLSQGLAGHKWSKGYFASLPGFPRGICQSMFNCNASFWWKKKAEMIENRDSQNSLREAARQYLAWTSFGEPIIRNNVKAAFATLNNQNLEGKLIEPLKKPK